MQERLLPLTSVSISLFSSKEAHRCFVLDILRTVYLIDHFALGADSVAGANILDNVRKVARRRIPIAPDFNPTPVVCHSNLLPRTLPSTPRVSATPVSKVLTDEQTTTRGHLDRAYESIVRPMTRLAGVPGGALFRSDMPRTCQRRRHRRSAAPTGKRVCPARD